MHKTKQGFCAYLSPKHLYFGVKVSHAGGQSILRASRDQKVKKYELEMT